MHRREVLLTVVVAVLAVTSAALAGVTLDLREDLEEARQERDEAKRERWDAEAERFWLQRRVNHTVSSYAWSAWHTLRWDEPWTRNHPRLLEEAQRNLQGMDRVLYITAPIDPQARALWNATNATMTHLVNVEAALTAGLANRSDLAPGVAGVGRGLREVSVALYPQRYGGEGEAPTLPAALDELHRANHALEGNLTAILEPVAQSRGELVHARLNWTRNVTGVPTASGGGGEGGEGDEVPVRSQPCDPSSDVLEPACVVANLTVTVEGTLPSNLTGQDATWGLVACPANRATDPGSACRSTANETTVGTWSPRFPNVTRVDDHTVRVAVPWSLVDGDAGLLVETRSKLGTHLFRDRCLLPSNGTNATCPDAQGDAQPCRRFHDCGARDGDDDPRVDLNFVPDPAALANGTLRGTATLHYARGDGALRFLPLEPRVTLRANVTTADGEPVTWTGSDFGGPDPYTNADLVAVPPGGRVVREVTWPGSWLTEANATYEVTLAYTATNDAEVTDEHWNGTTATGTYVVRT